jgi:hypothetical protein
MTDIRPPTIAELAALSAGFWGATFVEAARWWLELAEQLDPIDGREPEDESA